MKLIVAILLIVLVVCCAFEFDQDFSRIPKKCYHVCREGACQYSGCDGASCPGGACHFTGTTSSSCSGGACVFENSRNSSCDGGSCMFVNPQDTLRLGYCKGGGCSLNGRSHPDFNAYISI